MSERSREDRRQGHRRDHELEAGQEHPDAEHAEQDDTVEAGHRPSVPRRRAARSRPAATATRRRTGAGFETTQTSTGTPPTCWIHVRVTETCWRRLTVASGTDDVDATDDLWSNRP